MAPQSRSHIRRTRAAAAVGAGVLVAVALASGAVGAELGATAPRTFAAPVVVDTNDENSVAEPSIEVAPDGAVYVSGPQGVGGARTPALVDGTEAAPGAGGDLVWRSDNGGGSFTYLGSYDGSFGGGDSDIVAAPDGTLYASGLYAACVAVARSSNRGESWVNNPAACTDGGGFADRQWNDVDGNAAVYTGYGTLTQGLVLQKSETTSPAVVNGPTTVVHEGDYQWPGVVDVNPVNGNAVMVWNTSGTSGGTIDQIQINGVNRGGTRLFPAAKTLATTTGDSFDSFAVIDHGADGTLYAVWTERRPAVKETWTMLATSRDGGVTWGAPVHVDNAPTTTVFPWVTAGDAGRVAVTYYGTDSTGSSAEALDVKNAPWHVWSSFSTDFGATFTEYRTTTTELHRGSICTSGLSCPSGTRDLLDFFETDLDRSGCLLTVYTDNSRDVVTATGARSSDAATRIAVIRQSGGDGLRAGTTCAAATPTASGTSSSPSPSSVTSSSSPSSSSSSSPSASASSTASSSPSASVSASPSASASASASSSGSPSASASPSQASASSSAEAPSASASPACPAAPAQVRVGTPTINATGRASVSVTGAAPGARVELQGYSQNHYGTNSFERDETKVDRSGRADANGAITFSDLMPASNTRVRARQAECEFGPSAVIEVRATETLRVSRTGTRAYVVSGNSVPAREGGLLVSLFRIAGQSCAAGVEPRSCPGEVFIGQGRASASTGAYSIAVRFGTRDSNVRDELVVKTGRDAQNAPGRSNVRSLLIY